ncbi:MAG: cell division protein FtsZ [Thermodesulfobacteriota bacterium]|nr:cell division protein FtsZ [Thermodesulfobacteriota bacterium]
MSVFEIEEDVRRVAKIKIIGVGGGGCNAINTMISSNLEGVEFIAANTDLQALTNSLSTVKIQLGAQLTKGLGAGANPEIGRNATLEDTDKIREELDGADMIFITAGLGGGTGTGAAPIIADIAKELGALTVAVVTKPFLFEGKRRQMVAEKGLQELKQSVDTLIAIPNQRLLSISDRNISLLGSFKKADEVLLHAAKSISDLITIPGLINLDFADVKTIMSEMGMAFMGMGIASGENKAIEATHKAISSPLLEDISISGARGLLINISGGENLTLHEVNDASTLIQEEADDEANIIFGAVIDSRMDDEIRITVIATGFGARDEQRLGELKKTAAPPPLEPVEEQDVPAFLRSDFENDEPEVTKIGTIVSNFVNDEYDIPTFLRNSDDLEPNEA